MSTIEISPERLTVVKHLASGKTLEAVAEITRLPKHRVLDIGGHHGYPDTVKLAKAAELIEARLERDASTLPERAPARDNREIPVDLDGPSPHPRAISSPKPPPPDPTLTKPDEIRVLLNTAKSHPSKRIQNAANAVFDRLDKLRQLVKDDEEKHAEKRKQEEERERQRAEVKRLEKELADARAKLRGGNGTRSSSKTDAPSSPPAGGSALLSQADLDPHGLSSKDLREWAREHDVDVPAVGRLHRRILDAWLAAQPDAEAS